VAEPAEASGDFGKLNHHQPTRTYYFSGGFGKLSHRSELGE
jgi:hypothetical protein